MDDEDEERRRDESNEDCDMMLLRVCAREGEKIIC